MNFRLCKYRDRSAGFAKDEPRETLGEKLMLPAWFEANRARIEQSLTPFSVRVLDADKQ
ncbi:hypothetical protein [Cohnella algarum]|uniref:hypothetical protein n=1 Tax=Cohnella algarum TaxID=2044859 RepID=UPI0019675FA4|nr:hypothetical protein [Cohnella algarum]MBN2983678.1 hypothetical protein [Cohnella algarum]